MLGCGGPLGASPVTTSGFGRLIGGCVGLGVVSTVGNGLASLVGNGGVGVFIWIPRIGVLATVGVGVASCCTISFAGRVAAHVTAIAAMTAASPAKIHGTGELRCVGESAGTTRVGVSSCIPQFTQYR